MKNGIEEKLCEFKHSVRLSADLINLILILFESSVYPLSINTPSWHLLFTAIKFFYYCQNGGKKQQTHVRPANLGTLSFSTCTSLFGVKHMPYNAKYQYKTTEVES